MKPEEVRERAEGLVTRLEEWHQRQDRDVLARLRRGLSESTRQEAWTVLGPHFGPAAVDNPVYETVAGCFALHPIAPAPHTGNFGETLSKVMGSKMREENETHTRFRRLLACSDSKEICEHIRHAIRLAKSAKPQPASVNYRQLFVDLWWWNDYTKIAWAKAYWHVPAAATDFTLAGVGTPLEGEPAPMPE